MLVSGFQEELLYHSCENSDGADDEMQDAPLPELATSPTVENMDGDMWEDEACHKRVHCTILYGSIVF